MNDYPKRIDGIEINKVSDGYVVYHTEHDKVVYLNHTAAVLLEACDGQTHIDEIKQIIKDVFELDEVPEDDIKNCMNELIETSLITS